MKKWIIIGLICLLTLCGFVFCCNNLKNEEKLCYYVQNLNYNQTEHTLSGSEKVGFYNYSENVLSSACLHLYANAFREGSKAQVVSAANKEKAYAYGASYGNIKILSVKSGKTDLSFSIDGEDENILTVEFNKELYPDELFEFEIEFCVSLANINHRLGYGDNTINLCNYYPILCVYENGDFVKDLYHSNGDPFYSKVANYNVTITYPSSFKLASAGRVEEKTGGQSITSQIKAEKVRDFAMVLSEKFTVFSDTHNNVDINYYYYNDKNASGTMTAIKQVLDMNKKYGAYPYQTLSVAEANFVHGGMEYPSLVLIADNLDDYDLYINVVVHELCHQWWYGVVGNNEYAYGFLDEGLCDFNTALFYDEYPQYNHSSKEIFDNATASYSHFLSVYKGVIKDFSTKMDRKLNEFATEPEYTYLSYVKGMLMFANLKELLGDKTMTKCLKYYYECYKFKEATPQDLEAAFSHASGKNLYSFFDSWINGKDVTIPAKN